MEDNGRVMEETPKDLNAPATSTLASQAPSIRFETPVGYSAATSMLTIVPPDPSRPTTRHGEEAPPQQGADVSGDEANKKEETHDGAAAEQGQQTSAAEQQVPIPVPQTALTFLLVSGRRRTMFFDPEATVGRVKELVWNAWPSEWQDDRPPAPNYLRILYLGKILQDEDTLSKLNFPSSTSDPSSPSPTPVPTIVHLSIRPIAPPIEDDATLKKKVRPTRRTRSTGGVVVAEGVPPPAAGNDDAQAGCCGCIIC